MKFLTKPCLICLPILVSMLSSPSFGLQNVDTDDDSSYLPLRLGNVWNLRITDGLSYFDTGWRFFRVLDSLTIGGVQYVRCHNMWYLYPSSIDTMRTDTNSNAWRLRSGVEEMIFKFTATPGETWSFNCTDSLRMQMMYLGILDSFQLPEGPLKSHVFRQVKTFYGEIPNVVDSWISIAIAPGVGVIYRSSFQLYQVLYGAAIDGAIVGDTILSSVSDKQTEQPSSVQLHQNYPNPFNPGTTIRYQLPRAAHVTLAIFNALGQKIAQPVHEYQQSGIHEAKVDGSQLPSGVYFYRLEVGNCVQYRKMILLR